jgi:preprotein translocase subunit SecA
MYQEKAYQAFEKMFDTVAKKVVDNLMLSTIRLNKDNNLIVHFN